MLEFVDVQKRQDIDMKVVREQYLKLAQKYHPDVTSEKSNEKYDPKNNDEAFVNVKESFDRITTLDKESNGQLFLSLEYM